MFDTFDVCQMSFRNASKYVDRKSRYVAAGEHSIHCVYVRYTFNFSFFTSKLDVFQHFYEFANYFIRFAYTLCYSSDHDRAFISASNMCTISTVLTLPSCTSGHHSAILSNFTQMAPLSPSTSYNGEYSINC